MHNKFSASWQIVLKIKIIVTSKHGAKPKIQSIKMTNAPYSNR